MNPKKNALSKVRASNKLNPLEKENITIQPGSLGWEAITYPMQSFKRIKMNK